MPALPCTQPLAISSQPLPSPLAGSRDWVLLHAKEGWFLSSLLHCDVDVQSSPMGSYKLL